MSEPWEGAQVRTLSALLRSSWRYWTGGELLSVHPATASAPGADPDGDAARALYEDAAVILAHDGAQDPRFTYANAAGQLLWGIPWSEFIGMPSRFSAEPDQRAERQRVLQRAARDGIARNYGGVRVARDGRRFRIEGAALWTLRAPDGAVKGLAVRFTQWAWIAPTIADKICP